MKGEKKNKIKLNKAIIKGNCIYREFVGILKTKADHIQYINLLF